MKQILKDMIKIYKPKGIDWLGFKVDRNNPYSYHHIFKNVYGDYSHLDPNYRWNNGAILSRKGQAYIHSFENKDIEYYRQLNNLLKELNETMQPPTEEHWNKLNKVKRRNKNDY
jgi:hypothetical protein